MPIRTQRQPEMSSVRLAAVFALCFFLISLVTSYSLPLHAQEGPVKRVLVLHGVWKADLWESQFDAALTEGFATSANFTIDVSYRYLGLDIELSSESRNRLLRNIENVVAEQRVDLIIAALPAAGRFLVELQEIPDLSRILVSPNTALAASITAADNIIVIPSASDQAIETTIEQILILRPETENIEVIVGNSDSDTVYLQRTRRVATKFASQVNFNYQIGVGPERLQTWAAALPESSTILSLPHESSGAVRFPTQARYLETIESVSAVPIFGFYDAVLGTGIVGGNLTSTAAYARTTVAASLALLAGEAVPDLEGTSAATVYDWQRVQRWNIPLERLGVPYEVRFQPIPLWEERPILVSMVLNVILLLFVLLLFLATMLKRSKLVQHKIARSEAQARESESKYRLLAENSLDVIWTWDGQAPTVTYCSPSVSRLTGFSPEEFIARPLSEMMTPASFAEADQAFNDGVPEPKVLEVEHYTKDGNTVWCEIAAQPVFENGQPVGWVGVTRDISQRIKSDRERYALEEQVRHNQKFDSLGTLAGGIAHDMNNILAVIVGVTDLLKSQYTGNEHANKLLGKLMNASMRANKLVNQILTFSRQSESRKSLVKLGPQLHETLDLLQSGLPKGVELVLNIATDDMRVMGDASQIEQIIINLVTNSFESLDQQTGKITLCISPCQIKVQRACDHGELQAGDYALLQIEDTGAGLSADALERIFDPFYTTKELGNGMGLAIVHGIVMKHGGAIEVQSVERKGTTFNIYLPLTDAEGDAIELPPIARDMNIKRNILVIDDQQEILDVFSLMLKHLGHECDAYSDPQEAFAAIDNADKLPDLIITDYSMPGLNGLQVIDYCSKQHPSLPVVLSTGYGDSLTNEDSDKITNFILHKPFDLKGLSDSLHQIFAES